VGRVHPRGMLYSAVVLSSAKRSTPRRSDRLVPRSIEQQIVQVGLRPWMAVRRGVQQHADRIERRVRLKMRLRRNGCAQWRGDLIFPKLERACTSSLSAAPAWARALHGDAHRREIKRT
jgi:hypothetical protein